MALHETFRISDAAPQKMAGRLQGLRRRGRIVLYGLGVLVLLLLAWHFLGPLFAPKRKAPPPPPVKVAIAQRRDVTVTQNTIGTVVSPATVQVTAQVTGKLLAANFQEGDIVHKGDAAVPDRSGALSGGAGAGRRAAGARHRDPGQ